MENVTVVSRERLVLIAKQMWPHLQTCKVSHGGKRVSAISLPAWRMEEVCDAHEWIECKRSMKAVHPLDTIYVVCE